LVALDQGIGEELRAHALDFGACLLGIRGRDLQLDEPPDPRALDGETQVPQGGLDGFALRVEDPGLGPDKDGRSYRSTVPGSAAYSSNGIPVICSKTSR